MAHQENTHTVEKIISHEDYNPNALQNDIALLELAQPVNYNELASPVCFPDATFMDPDHLGICWTTGWRHMHAGSQKWVRFLHKTRTRDISKAECKVAWGNRIDEDVICAKNTGPNNTGCPVEAGSPLICLSQLAHRWILMGTLTMAPRDCQSAAVYTRLAHYIGWVKARTEAAGKPFIPLIPAAPDLLQQEGSALGSGLGSGSRLTSGSRSGSGERPETGPAADIVARAGGQRHWRWKDRFQPESLARQGGTLNRGGAVTPLLLRVTCCALSLHSMCLLVI